MKTFLVTIHDKDLHGEPDIALAVVDAESESAARAAADSALVELIRAGRCRCVASAREIDRGRFYRLGAVVRAGARS